MIVIISLPLKPSAILSQVPFESPSYLFYRKLPTNPLSSAVRVQCLKKKILTLTRQHSRNLSPSSKNFVSVRCRHQVNLKFPSEISNLILRVSAMMKLYSCFAIAAAVRTQQTLGLTLAATPGGNFEETNNHSVDSAPGGATSKPSPAPQRQTHRERPARGATACGRAGTICPHLFGAAPRRTPCSTRGHTAAGRAQARVGKGG